MCFTLLYLQSLNTQNLSLNYWQLHESVVLSYSIKCPFYIYFHFSDMQINNSTTKVEISIFHFQLLEKLIYSSFYPQWN